MRLFIFCVGIFFATSELKAQSSYFGAIDGTQEENDQLTRIYRAMPYGHSKTLTACESALKKNPRDRYARLTYAQELLEVGRPAEGKAELTYLETNFPNFTLTYDTLAWVALAQGDQKGALSAYKKHLQVKSADPTFAMLAESSKGWYETQILELEGKTDEAEKALAAVPPSEGKPYVRASAAQALGEFYLRQHKLTEAVKQLELAETIRTASRDPDVSAQVLLAAAQWAQGKRADALKSMIDTADLILDEKIADKEPLCKAVLSAYVLTERGAGTVQEKEKVKKLLRETVELFPDTLQYSIQDPTLAIAGKTNIEESIARTQKVLKEAPQLDWALWSALYLGLAEPTKAGQLLQMLPEGSLQKQIAEVEKKK